MIHSLGRLKKYLINDHPSDSLRPLDGIHSNVIGWANRVVTNGGAFPSRTTIRALDTFYRALVSASIDSKMISLCVFVPDSLKAATTPLITTAGNDPWTDTGFSAGALTVSGLKGDGTNYLNTGVIPSSVFASDNDGGLTVYNCAPYTQDASAELSVWDATSFNVNNKQMNLYCNYSDGHPYWDCYGAGTGTGRVTYTSDYYRLGYISGNRTASNSTVIYQANTLRTHQTINSGSGSANANRPTHAIYCFATNLNGTSVTQISQKTLSMAAIHNGLTSSESSNFFNAIQACRISLGGGFH